ncbi:MAG: hypothetical protein RL311_819 [Bacteroidota bacterium]|jgi:hypothetical protein
MNTQIKNLVGNYLIRNPYTKGNKKNLPFNVLGESFSTEYPVKVETFEYNGKNRNKVVANYTIESVLTILN